MTLHRRITTTLLISALSIGAVAVAPSAGAQAAPAAQAMPGDALAGMAQQAVVAYAGATVSDSSDFRAYSAFELKRDALAIEIANRLSIDPVRLRNAWRKADPAHQLALMAGLSQLGVRYRRNHSEAGVGFDCSGLTTYAWGQAGFVLPRSSHTQIRAAAARTRDTAQAGDLMYYPGHVMMYLGVDDAVLHSPYSGRNVEVDHLSKRRHNSVRFADPTG